MLELGMTENDPFDRPVFILRGTDGREAPTDLKGRLYLEYARPQGDRAARVAALAADLREKFNDIEDIARLRRARERRSLSSRYVTTQLGRARLAMKPDEIETLQRAFPTIEELVQSDPAAIANATGFDQELARKISQAFDTKSN
jgi:hypothetical protein